MVNCGTRHDRCPSAFSGPVGRPGATLRWRLENKKTGFWFQGAFEKISGTDLRRPTCALGRMSSVGARLFSRPPHCDCQPLFLLLPTRILGLRPLYQCSSLSLKWRLLSRRARSRPFRRFEGRLLLWLCSSLSWPTIILVTDEVRR
jgi:hypothetical protein